MVPFTLLEVTEYVDGRVFCRWETVADDGFLLVEGDVFTPDPDLDLEEAISLWLETKKTKREELNQTPPVPKTPTPQVKRATALLNLNRLKTRVDQQST